MNKNIERLKCFWTSLWQSFVESLLLGSIPVVFIVFVDKKVDEWYQSAVLLVGILAFMWWCACMEYRRSAGDYPGMDRFQKHGWYKTAGGLIGLFLAVFVALKITFTLFY